MSVFYVLTVWYALLYVVVEGYTELRCRDSAVDALLAQDGMRDALRLFRNATFHYQQEPISPKMMRFLEMDDGADWARKLNSALKAFFEGALDIRG